jgi:hypothetical protein
MEALGKKLKQEGDGLATALKVSNRANRLVMDEFFLNSDDRF